MALKTYQHLVASYFSTDVILNNKRTPIVFEGGTSNNPTRVTAKFSTDNPEIQRQIEARPDFGKEIKLFSVVKDPEPEPVKPKSTIPDDFTKVPDITTALAAKNYLLDRFPELKHGDLKNTAMVKEAAAERKIVFTDL